MNWKLNGAVRRHFPSRWTRRCTRLMKSLSCCRSPPASAIDGRILQYNRRAVELWGRAFNRARPDNSAARPVLRFQRRGNAAVSDCLVLQTGCAVRDAEIEVERPITRADRGPHQHRSAVRPAAARRSASSQLGHHRTQARGRGAGAQPARTPRTGRTLGGTYEHAAIGIVEIDGNARRNSCRSTRRSATSPD